MKTFILCGILCICLSQVMGETFSLNGTDPAYPGQCVYEGEAFEPGEYKLQRRCVKFICGSNGWISGHSCVPQRIEGCKPGELSGVLRPFPDCCKRTYKCHNEVYGDYIIESF